MSPVVVPDHRLVDPDKGRVTLSVRDGTATLAIRANHHDYCTRRLVHIVHEVFMVFLWDGPYYDYRCEHLGLNPDTGLPWRVAPGERAYRGVLRDGRRSVSGVGHSHSRRL